MDYFKKCPECGRYMTPHLNYSYGITFTVYSCFVDIQKIHVDADVIIKQLIREAEQVTERLTETYPCDKCKVEFCSRLCYRMTRWAEIAKEKLEEYETAEEDGRIVVLPCKIGTTVFQISYGFIFIEAINRWINTYDIAEKPFRLWMVDEYGKSIFLTRKEAEKALKEMKNNE